MPSESLTTRQQAVLSQLQRRFPSEHCEAVRQDMLRINRAAAEGQDSSKPRPPQAAQQLARRFPNRAG